MDLKYTLNHTTTRQETVQSDRCIIMQTIYYASGIS